MNKREHFINRLQQGVLVADGAMGTVLQAAIQLEMPYELACLTHPNEVAKAHKAYVDAGAELLETFTFCANRIKLAHYLSGDKTIDINKRAVELARSASDKAYVFGSVGPCGKPLMPIGLVSAQQAEDAFYEQIAILLEEGVDGLILETFSDMSELEIALKCARRLAEQLPIIAQKSFIEDNETISEGLPEKFAALAMGWGADVVGANCVVGPQRMLDIIRGMAQAEGVHISAFPTPGLPQLTRGKLVYDATPDYFAQYAKRLVSAGASIVGGCCGVSPEFIRAVKTAVDGVSISRTPLAERGSAKTAVEVQTAKASAFSSLLGQQYVVTVELDMPRGVNIDRVVDSAQRLKQAGAHAINLSDGARARLRMNPIAVSHLILEQVGIDVVMHMACRDRNMLALQADLLAAHALGIRNILAVTGDPAQIGDYPTATSVFDLDSVGLARILRRYNDGYDLAGNSIGVKANFTICAAFDPLSDDEQGEYERLIKKADAGAEVVFTQPIFCEELIDKAKNAAFKSNMRLIIGILPLRSKRHTEFMHHEVPGIHIPDSIRNRMMAYDDKDAVKAGIDIAQSLLVKASALSDGAYLMPPFGNPESAIEVMSVLR